MKDKSSGEAAHTKQVTLFAQNGLNIIKVSF